MSKTTKTQWFKAGRHEGVTLPSGTIVTIQIPNLGLMMKTGQLPNSLIEAAVDQQNNGSAEVTREMIEQQWEFYAFLVSKTVAEPQITIDEVEQVPAEDIEMIIEFATRQRDMDAVYKHLSGLETQESFRKFRGIASGDSDLADL